MKIIWLTQGQFALVDDEDYGRLIKHRWHAHKNGNRYYARTTIVTDAGSTKVLMHRMITNAKPTEVCDHKDLNGLNNQKDNIRNCNRSENGRNVIPKIGHSSKFKGVHFHKDTGKWVARITVGKKLNYLGLFASEVDAANTYNLKAKELHGEFARLNLIE